MKNGEFHHFWEISATCTSTGAVQPSKTEPVPVQVRYSLQNRTCTGTGQSCTGTGSALFFYFDHLSYFDHNLVIYYPI